MISGIMDGHPDGESLVAVKSNPGQPDYVFAVLR
jgi:hypothetical protein